MKTVGVKLGVSLALLLLPFGAAALDGVLNNTRMLRTLFVTVLIPLGSLLVREAAEFLTGE